MTEKDFIVDDKKRQSVDRAAANISGRQPTSIEVANQALLQVYEFNTTGGPMGVTFITNHDPESSRPSILGYEPEIARVPGQTRGYVLTPEGHFRTTVEDDEGEVASQEQFQLLSDAGIYTPTEQEWRRFVKLMKDMDKLTRPIGATTLKLFSLFSKQK